MNRNWRDSNESFGRIVLSLAVLAGCLLLSKPISLLFSIDYRDASTVASLLACAVLGLLMGRDIGSRMAAWMLPAGLAGKAWDNYLFPVNVLLVIGFVLVEHVCERLSRLAQQRKSISDRRTG